MANHEIRLVRGEGKDQEVRVVTSPADAVALMFDGWKRESAESKPATSR